MCSLVPDDRFLGSQDIVFIVSFTKGIIYRINLTASLPFISFNAAVMRSSQLDAFIKVCSFSVIFELPLNRILILDDKSTFMFVIFVCST